MYLQFKQKLCVLYQKPIVLYWYKIWHGFSSDHGRLSNEKKKLNIIWALYSPLPIIVYMKEYKKMEACQSNEQWSASDHLILPLY